MNSQKIVVTQREYTAASIVPQKENVKVEVLGGVDFLRGEDGVSPTVELESVASGVLLTITDVEGEHSEVIPKGEDGYTPIKGVDYDDAEAMTNFDIENILRGFV